MICTPKKLFWRQKNSLNTFFKIKYRKIRVFELGYDVINGTREASQKVHNTKKSLKRCFEGISYNKPLRLVNTREIENYPERVLYNTLRDVLVA